MPRGIGVSEDQKESKTMSQVDEKLDDVAVKQMLWKPGKIQSVAVAVTKCGLSRGIFYTDDVEMPELEDKDKNCIGIAFNSLAKLSIIQGTGLWRRSKRKESNGRKIFQYRLTKAGLARKFLERNGSPVIPPQMELF